MAALDVRQYLEGVLEKERGRFKSKASLARMAGISRATSNRIFRGDIGGVRIGNIRKLAWALGVNAEMVIGMYLREGRVSDAAGR